MDFGARDFHTAGSLSHENDRPPGQTVSSATPARANACRRRGSTRFHREGAVVRCRNVSTPPASATPRKGSCGPSGRAPLRRPIRALSDALLRGVFCWQSLCAGLFMVIRALGNATPACKTVASTQSQQLAAYLPHYGAWSAAFAPCASLFWLWCLLR